MISQQASLILGGAVRPIASINFMRGSQQSLHQDMAVFHIHPGNRLLGTWIALEDVDARSGPLVFHPGSHRSQMFREFDNYPQTNMRTADDDQVVRYTDWVTEQAAQWPEQRFLAKRGQVLFWHGMLIHGGSPIDDTRLTRRSMVVHFSTPSADRGSQTTGPKRW